MIFLGSLTIRNKKKLTLENKVIATLSGTFVRFFSKTQRCLWRVLFFGNDLFSLESLKALRSQQESQNITRLEVVSSTGRGNPVRGYADTNKIPCTLWPCHSKNIEGFDIGVVASFGYLIPKDIIMRFPLGMINVHASLLPRWRGASPITHAIIHGDTKTGITMMKIQPHRFDVGEIISQAELKLEETETFSTLLHKLSCLGAQELAKSINNLPHNLENAKPQDTIGVTYAPKITRKLAEINFTTMDATAIYALERAISHLYPLATNWNDAPVKLLKVLTSTCSLSSDSPQPGHIYYNKKTRKINVECCGRTFITFEKVVVNNRTMSSSDFYNGFISKVPEKQRSFKFKR